jgi:hypothetical protein
VKNACTQPRSMLHCMQVVSSTVAGQAKCTCREEDHPRARLMALCQCGDANTSLCHRGTEHKGGTMAAGAREQLPAGPDGEHWQLHFCLACRRGARRPWAGIVAARRGRRRVSRGRCGAWAWHRGWSRAGCGCCCCGWHAHAGLEVIEGNAGEGVAAGHHASATCKQSCKSSARSCARHCKQ